MHCLATKQKCSYDMLTFSIYILVLVGEIKVQALGALASVVEIKVLASVAERQLRSVAVIKAQVARLRSVLEEGENFSKPETFHNICFAHTQFYDYIIPND